MKLIGLTGGVGMGKSTAAGFLLDQGARVLDTDDIAREIVQPGQPALREISSEFGQEILLVDGSLNRQLLGQKVFADEMLRKKLERILHPRIRENWMKTAETWRGENVSVGVVVIPLLFETRAESAFQKIICVACSSASQRSRLAVRGWSGEQIRQRIAAQLPVDQKIARSDFILWSEGSPDVSRRQIIRIMEKV